MSRNHQVFSTPAEFLYLPNAIEGVSTRVASDDCVFLVPDGVLKLVGFNFANDAALDGVF